MKKIFAIALVLGMILTLTACSWNEVSVDNAENDGRITIVYNDGVVRIFVDNRTGIQYINAGDGCCVMVDEDGKPLVYESNK